MDFETFEKQSRRIYESIPAAYREGVDGMTVHRDALPHPRFPGVYTLGECLTESYPSSWDGPDTLRSQVLLHWGSFRALATVDPTFDWQEQIWETLTHELRHHLESLADSEDLLGVDYAMEQTFQRHQGLDFDPGYYRHGDRLAPGIYAVEDEVYIEQLWKRGDFERATEIRFSWAGCSYGIGHPGELGDVHFVRIVDGIPAPPYLELVLVRRSSWLNRTRAALRREDIEVFESAAQARE